MPFSAETKSRMFIKSARICCLCLKQCGTNIEAAHIQAEADKGSNDEDNGIPLHFLWYGMKFYELVKFPQYLYSILHNANQI